MTPADVMTWGGRLVVAVLCLVWAAALLVAVLEGPQAHARRRRKP